MGVGAASDLSDILEAIRRKLVSCGIADDTLVGLSLADDDTIDRRPHDRFFVVVSPGRFQYDQKIFDGSGLTVFVGTVAVALWIALDTDLDRRDEDWLREATEGALPRFRRVLACLSGFEPAAEGGGMMLVEPLRCTGFESRPRRRSNEWGKLTSWWEAKWWQALP